MCVSFQQTETSSLRSVQSQDDDAKTPPPRFSVHSARVGGGDNQSGPDKGGAELEEAELWRRLIGKLNSGVSGLSARVWLPLALLQQNAQRRR